MLSVHPATQHASWQLLQRYDARATVLCGSHCHRAQLINHTHKKSTFAPREARMRTALYTSLMPRRAAASVATASKAHTTACQPLPTVYSVRRTSFRHLASLLRQTAARVAVLAAQHVHPWRRPTALTQTLYHMPQHRRPAHSYSLLLPPHSPLCNPPNACAGTSGGRISSPASLPAVPHPQPRGACCRSTPRCMPPSCGAATSASWPTWPSRPTSGQARTQAAASLRPRQCTAPTRGQ
jgi:hypothetical protein